MTAAGIAQRIRPLFSFHTLFFLIVLGGFLLRFLALDLKLLHHDEAIHAWFAYELLTKGTYIYDPMYHGPLLYYVTAGMFYVFGQSDLVARLLPALFGAAIIPLVYAIYRLGYLDQRQALIAALFIAISPDLVYFSRFLRHDIFQLFFTALILVALLAYLERGKVWYALLAGLAAGGGMCLKEDMPLFLVIVALFGIYLLWKRPLPIPRTWKRDIVLAVLLAVAIMAAFYSSFGVHPEILVTGLEKAYTHWASMHGMCRICGPWFFYILLFLLYEVPVFLMAIFGMVQFADRHNPVPAWIARARAFLAARRPANQEESEAVMTPRSASVPVAWDKKEIFFLFCILWFLAALGAYAYIGEKVPWLIIHQLLPAIFVSVYLMSKKKAVFALAGCVFLVLMTWHAAFIPADVNEPIVQVQNSEDMRLVMALIDVSDSVAIASENYWPLPWYYRGEGWSRMHFYGKIVDEYTIYQVNPDMVITHDQASYASLDGYEKHTYKLSYWFSIYDNENRLPEYYVKRDGKMGSINIDVFTKPGLYQKAGIVPPESSVF
ncbi:MAG: Dolichyl-phosphate-mannose-protein mannosyltransferase [Methanoregulaceae archaeon PtaU1.Bin059]|nr:MAG: Dolichyl-phosphate-mannose-protein mannosyltransferase [Methanoregulaceae archaeon PtaU1.Bin059]